jgi:hypothetical protein
MLFGEYDATLEEERASQMNPKTDRMMKTPIVHAGSKNYSPSPVTIRMEKQQSSIGGSPHTANKIELFR